ncbi:MAG: VacJ family lipoprotein [Candidatus Omnitrophica bacterium]|nr:VacJ family lipoprotein [Candidatus Omnitrophota bacterium]
MSNSCGSRRDLWKDKLKFLILFFLAGIFLICLIDTSAAEPTQDTSRMDIWCERMPFLCARRIKPTNTQTPALKPYIVGYTEYHDPLKGYNKFMFYFNDKFYRYGLIPVAQAYNNIMPDAAQTSVGNFFYNIKIPIYAVNHLLQLKPRLAGRNFMRLGINSTIGILGLFDPAQSWFSIEKQETHLDDTLAQYGMGYGMYIVLPLAGSSDLRGTFSGVVEYYLNPIVYLTEQPNTTLIQGYDYFQEFAPNAENYKILYDKSDDPYIFFRNFYLQGVLRDEDF